MRVCQKQIKPMLLLSFCVFILTVMSVYGNDVMSAEGKMEIKTDRIQNDPDEEGEVVETELDRVFPELFEEEITEKIEVRQANNEEVIAGVKSHIFLEEMPETTSLYDIKTELFNEDYESPKVFAGETFDEESIEKAPSPFIYGGLVTFIGVIGVGVMMLFRKWEM